MITLLTRLGLWPSRPTLAHHILAMHIEQASAGLRRAPKWRGWDG